MNWGNLLLGIDLFDQSWWSLNLYHLSNLFFQLLMNLWSGLAYVVDGVESVFRSLAGLKSDGTVHDMASEIILHPIVQTIFKNLVGVAAALLVFFTIVKILQQQYKEKQGGNPYTIVFRMFKGMMMFFFVTAAVIVGLYASGVVFRALDSATGGGQTSVSGKVFKAMAYDANRLRVGDPGNTKEYETAEQYYYNRMTNNPDESLGGGTRYAMVTVTGNSTVSDAQAQAWYDSLPDNHWGIVNSDGSVTPLRVAGDLNTDKGKVDFGSINENLKGDGNSSFENDETKAHGSAGYHNDILTAVETKIQPAIDIKWSPIAIRQTTFAMKDDPRGVIPTDIFSTILGSGIKIPAGYSYKIYQCEQPYTALPVEENHLFSINMHGRAALQGGEASASFDLEAFGADQPVEKIMSTIIVNNLLVRMLDMMIGKLPALPLWFYVGPVSFNWISLAKSICEPFFTEFLNGTLYTLTTGMVESADEFITIGDGDKIPISWRLYDLFDEDNWEDLWKQLTNNFDKLKEQVMDSYEEMKSKLETAIKKVDELADEASRQKAWGQYKGIIDKYNGDVMNPILNLIYYADQFSADDFINKTTEEREMIEDEIVENWQQLIDLYTELKPMIRGNKPSTYKASTMVKQIYLPAFTTQYNRTTGYKLKAHEIVEELTNPKKTSLNLVKNPQGVSGVYRIVDWGCYEATTVTTYNKFADVYQSSPSELNYMKTSMFETSNFELGLKFINRTLTQGKVFAGTSSSGSTSSMTVTANDAGDFLKVAAINQALADEVSAATYRESSANTNGLTTLASSSTNTTNTTNAKTTASGNVIYNSKEEQRAAGEAIWQEMLAKANAADDDELKPSNSDSDSNEITTSGTYNGRSVVVFRRLNNDLDASANQTQTNDIKALNSWCKSTDKSTFPLGATARPIYDMDADEIDNFMCLRNSDRRYLMLANYQNVGALDAQQTYVGQMSYTNDSTLGALYELRKINYIMGYMGIIVALGVYMNFTFGLIQRAVNMAVLYIMSPITISFYPFDDGQRFKGQFVTPFYKEAISAYAVIISLNVFMVLLTPVQTAVENVAGKFMGFVALIAFVSMLPKMREMITGMLGAGSLQQKSLTDMFKDAGNTLADPFKQMNTMRKAPINAAKKAGMGAWNSKAGRYLRDLADRRAKSKSDFAKDLMGKEKLSKKEQKFLDKYKKKHGIVDQNQDKIDKAIAAGKGSSEWNSLSKSERAMAKKQMKAAMKQAEKDLQNGTLGEAFLNDQIKNGATPEIREKAKKQLAALQALQQQPGNEKKSIDQLAKEQRQKELLNDRSFVNSVDGVNTRKKIGKALEDKFKYTLVGDALATMFHPASGMLVKDKDSLLGNAIKWGSSSERAKRLKHMYWEEKEWRDARTDGKVTKTKDAWQAGLSQIAAINSKNDTAKKVAAQMQARDQAQQAEAAAGKKIDDELAAIEKGGVRSAEFKQAYLDAAKKRMMKENGFTEQQANQYAEMEYGQKSDKQLKAEWQKMVPSIRDTKLAAASAETAKMAKSLEDDLIRGVGGIKIDPKYLEAAKSNSARIMDMDANQAKAYQKELANERRATVNAMVGDMTKQLNLSAEDAKGLDDVVMQSITAGDDMNTVTAKIMAHLPAGKVEEATVRSQMDTSGFANKVSQMQFDFKQESTMVDGALTYNKKLAGAQATLRENLNLDISDPRWEKVFNSVFRPMYDTEMKGGLIDQQNMLLEKYHGDASDPNYLREVETLSNNYSRQFDNAMDRLVSDDDVFRRDTSNKISQQEVSERRAEIAVEMDQRLRYHLRNNMGFEAKKLALMDTKLDKMERSGDFIGSSLLLRNSVEAAIAKDWDKLNASGLDEQTITQIRDWSEAGNMKDLNDIIQLTDIKRQMFGNADGDGADNVIRGASDQLSAMYRMSVSKLKSEELSGMAKVEGDKAGAAGKELEKFMSNVNNKFKGAVWTDAVKIMDITTPEGRLIRDDKEFRDYLKDVSDRIIHTQLAPDSAEVDMLLDKLATLKGTWGEHKVLTGHGVQGNQAAPDIEYAIAGINNAIMSVNYQGSSGKLNTASGEAFAGFHEQYIKATKQDKKE